MAENVRMLELWTLVEPDKDAVYRWLVWKPGPISGMDGHWFETEDEARAYIDSSVRAAGEGDT